jgi:3-hydroxyisobutyrate dehydrogenase-like beta-hydroxyacid dehydrogenase
MANENYPHRIGWIGAGRMGAAIIARLLNAGVDVAVYNRTKSKAEPLVALGARLVDTPLDLADCDIVFTMVAGPKDVLAVTVEDGGVLSGDVRPAILVDATTIDPTTSAELSKRAAAVGTAVLAAPVSGNPKVVASGGLTVVSSGPKDAFQAASPYLELFGKGVTYVGAGDEARLVKICHNLMLGIVSQTMAETCALVGKAGVSRHDYLDFLNDSVMGSVFTRYKTPAYVNLDFKPTFTWPLLRKDFELGLQAARELDVPLPASALVHQIVVEGIGRGMGELDFAALVQKSYEESGQEIEAENREIDDGLTA